MFNRFMRRGEKVLPTQGANSLNSRRTFLGAIHRVFLTFLLHNENFATCLANALLLQRLFIMQASMFLFCQALQINNSIVRFIIVEVMNVIPFGNFSVIICEHNTVNKSTFGIMPVLAFEISDAVKTLMSIVNDFNDGRSS